MAVTTLGAFPGANSKDKSARIPAAIAALNKALAGDQQALAYMRQQSQNSATAVGKDAFRRALAYYDSNKPAAAPKSTATPPPTIVPIPRPPVRIDPLPVPTVGPPPPIDYVSPPPDLGGMTVPVNQPKPIGFDSAHPPLTHPPSIRVRALRPGQVKPVTVGSPVDGGVITSTPAPEYSGPVSAPQAPADFGYAAPTAAPTVDSAATPPTAPDNKKVLLVLAAGVVLWLLVEGKRK